MRRLRDVAEMASGGTPLTSVAAYYGGGIPWVSINDMTSNSGRVITKTERTLSLLGLSNSAARLFPTGTVLYAMYASIGECSIAGRPLCTSQAILGIRPRRFLHPAFLYYWMTHIKSWINTLGQQGTQANLNKEMVMDIRIPAPPNLSEQRAIAAVLTDADALIGSLEALMSKQRAIKQAAMQQLLTGKTRLPGFEREWEVRRLGDVANIKSGGTPNTAIYEYWNGDIPWCTPTDITTTTGKNLVATARSITATGLSNSGATLLPRGALLLCSRATIGEVKIAAMPVATNQGFKSLVCGASVDYEFVYYTLLTLKEQMIDLATGSTFQEISKRDVANIRIPLPPLPEQRAIATVLSDMDELIESLERRLAKMRALKQGMMQQLLTGSIRLPIPDAIAANGPGR